MTTVLDSRHFYPPINRPITITIHPPPPPPSVPFYPTLSHFIPPYPIHPIHPIPCHAVPKHTLNLAREKAREQPAISYLCIAPKTPAYHFISFHVMRCLPCHAIPYHVIILLALTGVLVLPFIHLSLHPYNHSLTLPLASSLPLTLPPKPKPTSSPPPSPPPSSPPNPASP